jgi:hypothetical protein
MGSGFGGSNHQTGHFYNAQGRKLKTIREEALGAEEGARIVVEFVCVARDPWLGNTESLSHKPCIGSISRLNNES